MQNMQVVHIDYTNYTKYRYRICKISALTIDVYNERSQNIEENVFAALFTIENAIDLQYTKRLAQSKITILLYVIKSNISSINVSYNYFCICRYTCSTNN